MLTAYLVAAISFALAALMVFTMFMTEIQKQLNKYPHGGIESMPDWKSKSLREDYRNAKMALLVAGASFIWPLVVIAFPIWGLYYFFTLDIEKKND